MVKCLFGQEKARYIKKKNVQKISERFLSARCDIIYAYKREWLRTLVGATVGWDGVIQPHLLFHRCR